MSETLDASSRLPIPFFQVLLEEDLALHDPASLKEVSWERTLNTENAWLFHADHLSDSLRQLEPPNRENSFRDFANRLRELLCQNAGEKDELVTEEALVNLLNELVKSSPGLCHCPRFPMDRLQGDGAAYAKLRLSDPERLLVNRLLLEDLFSAGLKRIYDIRLARVHAGIHARAKEAAPQKRKRQTALCLSGGGIRSATFALGILQGLSRRDFLPEIDYLSTVSGGGFMGSWLSCWIHHAKDSSEVFAALKSSQAASPTEPEPKPVRYLRMFSNYLTPKLGAFSADTWTLIGTYLRNLFVNWLVFVPLLLALFGIPRAYLSLLRTQPPPVLFWALLLVGALGAACSLAYATVNRPTVQPDLPAGAFWSTRRKQGDFLLWGLLPLVASGFCLTTCWFWLRQHSDSLSGPHIHAFTAYPPQWLFYVGGGLLLHLAGWLFAQCWLRRFWVRRFWVRELAIVLLTGALGGLFIWIIARLNYQGGARLSQFEFNACFGLPIFLSLFLVTASIFIALLSRKTSDEDREWWARMGAWILIVVVAWIIFNTLVLFGPQILLVWTTKWLRAGLLGAGGVAGVATLLLGHNSSTPARSANQNGFGWSRILLMLSAPLSLAYIVVGLALLTSWLLTSTAPSGSGLRGLRPLDDYAAILRNCPLELAAGFVIVAAGFGLLLSRAININRFSLHAIYRDRLVRAYLGASNPRRHPNPFTGFDPGDNLRLHQLRDPVDPRLPQRPLHVVNMALNLVAGENLAWQQRKAETFTASSLYCGNYRLGFRHTQAYARNQDGLGLSVGSAVAISGAAASPNQGYHSSPLVAMLMTLFNIRLGWWLGNPGAAGHDTFSLPAPTTPVLQMVKEGLGMTDSRSPYVYLSDGGHFENLGLYEMILRRCHLIIVSDAGCDPDCTLEDLGNAIRKIRIDLGVNIEMDEFSIFSRNDPEAKTPGKYFAIGKIDYAAVDGDAAQNGTLIYLKPAVYGPEPRDIFNYQEEHKDFPHESTGDQWFSESQFESYRHLGLYVIDQVWPQIQPYLKVGAVEAPCRSPIERSS